MKKTATILTLICFILIGCKNQNGVLQVKQINTIENNIVLRYSEKMETFWAINIPISFEISNNSSKDVKFTSCTYLYNNQIGRHSKLYLKDNVNLTRVNPNDIKLIKTNNKQTYVIYSQHLIDTLKYNKKFFEPYLMELKKVNQDTLTAGRLSEFKSKHLEFLKSLIKEDSLELQFLKPNNDFEKPVRIPVEW